MLQRCILASVFKHNTLFILGATFQHIELCLQGSNSGDITAVAMNPELSAILAALPSTARIPAVCVMSSTTPGHATPAVGGEKQAVTKEDCLDLEKVLASGATAGWGRAKQLHQLQCSVRCAALNRIPPTGLAHIHTTDCSES